VQAVVPRFTTDSRGAFAFTLNLDTSILPPADAQDGVGEPDSDSAGDGDSEASDAGGGRR
jgi:hypothetical protein